MKEDKQSEDFECEKMGQMAKITAYVKRVGKVGTFEEIDNTLEGFETLVSGRIESHDIGGEVTILFDEDAKLLNMPMNMVWIDKDGNALDVIAGDCFFVRYNSKGGSISIENDDLAVIKSIFMPIIKKL